MYDFIVKFYHENDNYKYNDELTRELITIYYKNKYHFKISGFLVDELSLDKDLRHRINRSHQDTQII